MSLITTPFNASSTAEEVVAGIDLSGKQAIVTGAASGIGIETARALAKAGATVTLAVRDVDAGKQVAADIQASTGNSKLIVAKLDLTNRQSIAEFANSWQDQALHILINNAGIMACPLTRTPEGWELQFATNHLGHFALTTALHRALAAAQGARIVSVSSGGHMASPVVFEDIQFEQREYNPWSAYGQSKTANVLLAVEATRRWQAEGIIANALMPGAIMTKLQQYVPQATLDRWEELEKSGKMFWKNTEQGAATSLVAAVAPEFATGGHYLEDCNEAETVANDAKSLRGVREWALDPTAAQQLWEVSERLIAV